MSTKTPEEKAQQLSIFNREEEFANSFTRKVTIRMMKSLGTLKTSIDRGEENRIVDLEGAESISANFIESIVELSASKENSEIEINTSWSVFAMRPNLPPKTIKFSNDYIPVFQSLIDKIKPVEEEIDNVFIGRISQAKADPDPNSRKEGEIILNYVLGDEEKVSKARIILEKDAYDNACEAHKNGQTVRVKGRLVTTGRSKSIENPKFEIIQ